MGLLQRLGSLLEATATKVDPSGFLVQLVKHDNASSPGREAQGVVPIRVVGHDKLKEAAWREWVYDATIESYGDALAKKAAVNGIDLKELLPYGLVGRRMKNEGLAEVSLLNELAMFVQMVEQYPATYNGIVFALRGEDPMKVEEFLDRVMQLPNPIETGGGRMYTLGDLIARTAQQSPRF